MASFHEILTRGQQTIGIWEHFAPTLAFGSLTLQPLKDDVAAMPAADQAIVDAEAVIDEARDLRAAKLAVVRELATRLPRLAANCIGPDDSLQDDILFLQGIVMSGEELVMDRGQKTLTLWTGVNARRAAATPAEPALTLPKGGGGTWAVADLGAALSAVQPLAQDIADAAGPLSEKRSARRVLSKRVDRANKRWYEAWAAHFPVGTAEHDALTQITTEDEGGGSAGSSSSSSSSSSSGPLPLPGAPQNVVLTTGDADSGAVVISLDPAPPAQEVTGYHVYRDGVFRAATGGPTVLDGFTPGESVTLTMRALNATGEGPDSAEASGTAG